MSETFPGILAPKTLLERIYWLRNKSLAITHAATLGVVTAMTEKQGSGQSLERSCLLAALDHCYL